MLSDEQAGEILNAAHGAATWSRGGNSRVVRVEFGDRFFAVKDYSDRSDGRSRLEREWLALSFLSPLLPDLLARPIWRPASGTTAIHSWLPGHRPGLDANSVKAVLRRLGDLHGLRSVPGAIHLPPAIDSVGELSDLVVQIRARCAIFAASDIIPIRRKSREILLCLDRLLETPLRSGGSGCGYDGPGCTSGRIQTLSQSDVGPHNLLRDPTGAPYRIVDLEFFGLDDAHKLVGDTILHPQTRWTSDLLEQFRQGVRDCFDLQETRLAGLLPLLSLKWATIVLARYARDIRATPATQVQGGADGPSADLFLHFLAVARARHHEERLGLISSRGPSPPSKELR